DATFRQAQPSRPPLALSATRLNALAVVRGGTPVAEVRLAKANEVIRCFTLLSDSLAAVGGSYGLYLFDTRTGPQVREFRGHTGFVWGVAPSPDGRHLLSASDDQTVRVWSPDRDEALLSLFGAGDEWVAWTPEGYYACSAGGERLMGWHVQNGRDQM